MIIPTVEPAINRGIKAVGVGKKGSRHLSPELAQEILEQLRAGKASAAAQGAFFAGLISKGVSPDETILEQAFTPGTFANSERLVKTIAGDAPEFVQNICIRILKQETLDRETAYRLGKFLFSNQQGDGARGLVASFLRVRYETADEYEGLLQAMQETLTQPFRNRISSGPPVLQLAEPFDGVDHSYMITPLIGACLQKLNYRVVHLIGRNSGPKFVFNLADLIRGLNVPFAKGTNDLAAPAPSPFGWFFHQADMAPAVDRWVELRHQTIKRPFLATLERFLNPADARIMAASAFHPPYGEKMLTAGERAGFPGILIIRNGIEGSLAFPLKREVRLLCSARQKDGSYQRHEIIFDAGEFSGYVETEEKLENPSLDENVRLVQNYLASSSTDNALFDRRVKATAEGFRLAVEWLEKNMIDERSP